MVGLPAAPGGCWRSTRHGAAEPPVAIAAAGGPWLHVRMRRKVPFATLGLLALAACGGGKGAGTGGGAATATVTIAPPPEPVTRATLVGPLCEAEVCRCRDTSAPGDGGAGEPGGAVKRFEVRVGPSEHELWVTLDDMVLFKSTARAEDCFYVDLGPGDHRMGLRASHAGGVAARVTVKEYAPATRSWYDTFTFACGAPGVCAHADLEEYKASLAVYKRGIHDPCGSVKVKQLAWDTGVAPDQLHPDELQVAWTLDLYDFAPRKPHGDPSCATRFE